MAFEPFTLDQLTVFLAVVDEGSFSAAARALGRVQSAVSHSVASLEGILGARLFDRGRRPLALTDAGRRLAEEAGLVLAQARELRQAAGAIREGLEAELTLAVDPIYPQTILADALGAFHARFPTVPLRLHTDLLGEALQLVRAGEADLGLCNLAEGHDRQLDALPAAEVTLVPVCAPTHPLAAEPAPQRADQLQRFTQVVLTERLRRADDLGVLAPRTWRVTDLALKKRLIEVGVGWGSLPTELADDALAAGALVRLSPEPWLAGRHEVVLHSVVRTDRPLGPAGSWLRQQLTVPPA